MHLKWFVVFYFHYKGCLPVTLLLYCCKCSEFVRVIRKLVKSVMFTNVVSIEFSPLGTIELTTNGYQLQNGDYG